ncbi:phytosulfokines 5-like isoform X1 [Miscanthus floridulus]|uniref:phytosulfokines 5-like isoform X1 n=1 Tax=Miscanthus floridulus TaxID=154761 RepID=UPI00345AEE0F
MRRCGSTSSPLAAAALLLLLLLVAGCFHCAAAARLLPPSSVPIPALVHQAENGVKAAGAADGGLVLQEGGVGNGDELSIPEMMGADSEEEEEAGVACEEGNDECMQRRLLHDAHLDYIYTQHKGKP